MKQSLERFYSYLTYKQQGVIVTGYYNFNDFYKGGLYL